MGKPVKERIVSQGLFKGGVDDVFGQPIHADTFYRGLVTGAAKTVGKSKKHANTAAGYFRFVKPRSQYYFCTLPGTRTKGGQQMKAKDLNKAIQRAAKQAGLAAGRKEDGIVAHSFRGFFKSHCIKQLIPREIIDAWQGHRSDDSIGTRHYFETSIEDSIEFMKKVDFGSI